MMEWTIDKGAIVKLKEKAENGWLFQIGNVSALALMHLGFVPNILLTPKQPIHEMVVPKNVIEKAAEDPKKTLYGPLADYDMRMFMRYLEDVHSDLKALGVKDRDILYFLPIGLVLPTQSYFVSRDEWDWIEAMYLKDDLNEEECEIYNKMNDLIRE